MATFNKAMWWIILGSLLLVAACANGGSSGPGSTPSYGSPYYSPSDYPEQDLGFWRMWEDRQGGGG